MFCYYVAVQDGGIAGVVVGGDECVYSCGKGGVVILSQMSPHSLYSTM